MSSMATTATNVPNVTTTLTMDLDQEALQQALLAAITITIETMRRTADEEATVSEPAPGRRCSRSKASRPRMDE